MKQLCKKAINEEVKEDEVSFNRSFNVRHFKRKKWIPRIIKMRRYLIYFYLVQNIDYQQYNI